MPSVHPFVTADGYELLLTRFKGGAKGPVMLTHGLGVSSQIFTIDTTDTNLVEYLCINGYDVWLLDYRVSTALPSARLPFTADVVAQQDYPAAVEQVRCLTGASTVQVIAHCYGSTTFTMAMLAGLEHVRAAVCSQVSTHIVAPAINTWKSGLHIPSVLDALGVSTLSTDARRREGLWPRLFDKALNLWPMDVEEECTSAVCHRISFYYGLLYEHAQLNERTHDQALAEMFGEASIDAFEQLAAMIRRGTVVAADGTDPYMHHLERMALPVTFIHGERNACFLPESTRRTVKALSDVNGPQWYDRHVIPGYGHIDCIFGKDAARDVYPKILAGLEPTATL